MSKRRDDFTERTKMIIGHRAGWVCSNPDCNRHLVGANATNVDGYTNLGVAAHITAAAPNGPRYDPNLTTNERKSAGNGILLCPLCATIIDKDPELYPTELLLEWKKIREDASIEHVNRITIPRERIFSFCE